MASLGMADEERPEGRRQASSVSAMQVVILYPFDGPRRDAARARGYAAGG